MGAAALPLAIASGVLQSGLTIVSQRASAKAQAEYQKSATEAERTRLSQQQSAERIQEAFQNEERARELQQASAKAQAARATATVSAQEAGVSGLSVDNLLNDYYRQEAVYRFGLTRQEGQMDVARDLRMKDAGLQSYNTQLSINKPIKQPNVLGSALTGLTTGLSIYDTTYDMKNPFAS